MTEQGKRAKRSRKLSARMRFGLISFLAGIATAALVLFFYLQVLGNGQIVSRKKLDYYSALDGEFGRYYEMKRTIAREGYYKAKDEGLDESIAKAVIATVPDDPYAQYFSAEEYSAFERKYVESYTGIGVAIDQNGEGNVVIRRVLKDGAADESGVAAGDVLLKVDGKNVKSLKDASDKLSGKAGEKVEITVERNGNVKEYSMYRTAIEENSVSFEKPTEAGGIGYIRIATFRKGTTEELKKAIHSLQQNGCSKVVIDVRGNPGGITDEGIDAADLLLPKCKIVSVKDKRGKTKVFRSDAQAEHISYAVLVDGDTASAAEIFSAAIKENGGGRVIGTKTYGKGLIQSLYDLNGGAVIKLTTAEYLSPKGHKIDGKGVSPDVEAEGAAAIAAAHRALSEG